MLPCTVFRSISNKFPHLYIRQAFDDCVHSRMTDHNLNMSLWRSERPCSSRGQWPARDQWDCTVPLQLGARELAMHLSRYAPSRFN